MLSRAPGIQVGKSQCFLVGEKSEGQNIPWWGITGKAQVCWKGGGRVFGNGGKDLWRGPLVEVWLGLVCLERGALLVGESGVAKV